MKRILMVIGMVAVISGVMAASTDTVSINLLVTPVTFTNLNIDTTYYNFGNVSVGASTASVTALVLSNAGSIGVTVDKAVWAEDDWYVTEDDTATNGFNLWAMTNASAQPAVGDYGASHAFDETDLQDFDTLTDSGGTAVSLIPEESANLYFRLDMPADVTSGDKRTIGVRLRANSI